MNPYSPVRKFTMSLHSFEGGDVRADREVTTAFARDVRNRIGLDAAGRSETAEARSKSGTASSLAGSAVSGVFSAATMTSLAQMVVAYIRRHAARESVIHYGERSISITDASAGAERSLVEWFMNGPATASTDEQPGRG